MIPVRKLRVSRAASFATVIALTLPAYSQVVEMVSHDGKTYACQRSGIMGAANSCGTQNYDVVVVGTILSVKPAYDSQIAIVLKTEEIFKGEQAPKIDILTSQPNCFPDLRAGDRWLFYLLLDKETDALTLAFGSGSGPVAQQKASVDRLRRLAKFRGSGMIVGEVDESNGRPRAHHPIVVKRVGGGAQFTVYTGKDGRFEFPPLPAGKYNLNPNTVHGLKATWSGEITVEARQCANYFVSIEVDGRISGLVRNADGTPAESVAVEAVAADASDNGGGSAVTDERGHYEIHGLDAGRYLVGLRIADAAAGGDSLYAPGVKDRKKALTVSLGQAERRAGINIRVPSE
jgi:hypothetical protein